MHKTKIKKKQNSRKINILHNLQNQQSIYVTKHKFIYRNLHHLENKNNLKPH